MKKEVIITIIALLVLSSCAGMPGQTKEEDLYGPEYRTGTQGLIISFMPGLPSRLFDTEQINAIIQVQNMGAFDVGGPGDKIYLSGFDQTLITGILEWGEDIPLIEGKSQFVPQGGMDTVVFKGNIAPLRNRNIDKYPVRLLATACYEYETIATAGVCIDPTPRQTGITRKICTPQSVSLGSQGAPVAVSLIEMDASPSRTRFKINVQNVGGGEVFKYGGDYLHKCSPFTPPLQYNEVDYVELVDVFVSGTSIKPTCKPLDDNHIRLTNGQGVVYCEFTTRGQDAYTTPLTGTLRYVYRNTAYKDLELVSAY